ncbi:hypothetical protein CFOL_v3_29564 [Cephalotus follicularis]|uniref:Uncharacterized protein n=1 Tax=Cephalotus follicularis TaxID=3775 RepID=A0A1Q3D146_CEPFO|nr:hypothetical protein CFOL_v3_29564 [Cephalotus follicularis]
MKSGSGKMPFEVSLSFNGREMETMFSCKTPESDLKKQMYVKPVSFRDTCDQLQITDTSFKNNLQAPLREPGNHRNQAALKLQKVYKSFRTRRQLADCAVLVEQRWWKLLDFAELKRSSISFFDIEKPETAISRWSRARTRAAKVGKGLSKDEKARKLALQHWLEAIDPRHRYGHNLQFYYVTWLHCESQQPFFYWLDIGEGKEVNPEKCPRSKLQQQCIKYLGPTERKAYEVVVENGKFSYNQSGKLLDTTGEPKDAKWIFVLSASKTLYIGQKQKGKFQHSSFLAGGATLSAGRLVVEEGIIKAVWPHSGHYLPTEENFQEFMSFLKEHNVDITNVEKNPVEEEEIFNKNGNSYSLRSCQSEADLSLETEATYARSSAQENNDSRKQDSDVTKNPYTSKSRLRQGLGSKISTLEIPTRDDIFDVFKRETHPRSCRSHPESPAQDGYETAEESFLSEEDFMISKINLFDEDEDEEEDDKPVPREKILRRIDSHKGMKSYQLAQHLSSKWTTGAGPRIGCMRDYPSELQARVLEQANLSPKARSGMSPLTPFRFSPKVFTPTSLCRETTADKS